MRRRSGRNKIAIVTGTSSGIGEAVAKALVANGWFVLGLSRRQGAFQHDAFHFGRMDLSRPLELFELEKDLPMWLVDPAITRVGLVNNAAAIGPVGYFDTIAPETLSNVLTVNVVAPVLLMNLLMRSTAAGRTIRIVNVSTGAAVDAYPGIGAYSMSKAALRMAGMSLASEWDDPASKSRPADAAILSYEPGLVDTAMQKEAREQSHEAFPWDMFRGFKRENLLVPPERPAAEIVEFLESDKQPSFSERRLRT